MFKHAQNHCMFDFPNCSTFDALLAVFFIFLMVSVENTVVSVEACTEITVSPLSVAGFVKVHH